MKNKDMPANAAIGAVYKQSKTLECILREDIDSQWHFPGETKYEKAFWQVYSAFLSNSNVNPDLGVGDLYKAAIEAVNAGFEALENRK